MDPQLAAVVGVVQAGGVLAFALVVYLELRRQGTDRKAEREAEAKARADDSRELRELLATQAKESREVLSELAGDMRSLLERQRMGETPAHGVPFRPGSNRP